MPETNGILIYGGDIITVDDSKPEAEAVALIKGKIAAVGSLDECKAVLGDAYTTIDLHGQTLLPGFIDTHMHPLMLIYYKMNADMRGVGSLGELEKKLRKISDKSSEGSWVIGLDFDEQDLQEAILPTRKDLDKMCPENPVLLIKHDGHMAIANTKAIELAGVDANTKDPEGGIIDREDDGYPAGPFREMAAQMVKESLPFPEIDELIQGASDTANMLLSQGITSVGGVFQTDEDGPAGKSGAFEIMAMSMLLESFPLSIYSMLFASKLENLEMAKQSALHSDNGGRHKVGALKLIADGSFGSCTSYMREPFTDQPDKSGILLTSEDELYRRMEFAHKAGYQIAIHAIGDKGVELCVDLFEKLLEKYPRDNHRHRIEHASIVDKEILKRIKNAGLVISTQPLFIHTEKDWLPTRLGQARLKNTYPFKSILDAAVKLAGASDAPVESTSVLDAIQCCVTRENFEIQECINVLQAIKMYTIDAAFVQFEENIKGSISVGKRADLIILDRNPLKIELEKIKDIKVKKTMVGGQIVQYE